MSALLPERSPLGVWYLVTPEGLSSVKITDGLAFTEEDTQQGKKLALVPRCADDGLIRFRVNDSGIWLSVCDENWQISGAEGVVVRPFPIFRPVDLFFRDSVVHLRPDISVLESDEAIELFLERVPEIAEPILSRSSISQLQHRINTSQQRPAAVLKDRPAAAPAAIISPLREPGFKKIAGQGRPSSVRLIPDPAPPDEIPLLTNTVEPGASLRRPSASVSLLREGKGTPAQDIIVKEPHDIAVDESVGLAEEMDAEESRKPLPVKAPAAGRPSAQRVGREVEKTAPKRRIFSRLLVLAASLFLVSTDLPDLPIPVGIGDAEKSTPAEAEHLQPAGTSESISGAPPAEPAGRSETSQELMAAVEALLESKSPADPVTRQFVEDAMRAVNEAEVATDGRLPADTPGSAGAAPESAPVATPGSMSSRN